MHTIRAAAVLAAALFLATAAAAQDAISVSLAATDPPRWDITAQAGWLGGNPSARAVDWSPWYSTRAGGLTLGRYLTPHLKAELQGTISGTGRIYVSDPAAPFEPRVHNISATTLHGGVGYQFFENQWFHPFVAAGVEIARERRRIDVPAHFRPTPSDHDQAAQLVPASAGSEQVTYAARPFVATGFKWFVSDRAFVRGDVAASVAGQGFARTMWSAGVGFEF